MCLSEKKLLKSRGKVSKRCFLHHGESDIERQKRESMSPNQWTLNKIRLTVGKFELEYQACNLVERVKKDCEAIKCQMRTEISSKCNDLQSGEFFVESLLASKNSTLL